MKASRDGQAKTPDRRKNKQKKNRPFARYMRKKLAFTFAVVTLALFALAIVLLTISRDNNEEYKKIIFAQQDYESRTIAFRRGDILDRNGTVLATTTRLYNLILDPVIITSEEKYTDTTIDALVECYGYDRNELVQLINEKKEIGSRYVIYTREMSEEDMNRFLELKAQIARENSEKEDKSEREKRVAGVWFETKYKRIYPYDDLACWILGFSRDDSSVGSYGIEQYYNDELVGVNGREYGYLNDDTNLERVVKPAEDGNTIVTTIDATLQRIIQDDIAEAQNEGYEKDEEPALKAVNIGVIVMDPNNGEILAMAGDAAFNCNDPANTDALLGTYTNKYVDTVSTPHEIYTESMIESLTEEERVTALTGLWRNFGISFTYEPGSTAKSLTVAAALDEGKIRTNQGFDCDGYEMVGGWKILCNNGRAHGHQSLTVVLENSCNDALMSIGAALGRHDLSRYQVLYGFGQKTGVDLPGEESGIIYQEDNMDVSTVATNAFGQNYNVTMLQQIAAYCSIINGGTYYQPHIVRQIKSSDGAVLKEIGKEAVKETISADTSRYLREALLSVVDEGTGGNAKIDGYEVWGKTGTAEKVGRDKTNYLLSFIGGVPASDPQVVLYVVVDSPKGVEKQPQSKHASTLWRNIMEDILPYLNLYPTRPLENPPEETEPETDPAEAPETDENGNPITAQPQTAYQEDEDDFSGGIFVDPNAEPDTEPEGAEDPENNGNEGDD